MNKYFNGDDFASQVWGSKYAAEGEESPDDMHLRMAKEFAKVRFIKDTSKTLKSWEKYFFNLFKNFGEAIPQGRVMAGLGVDESYRSLSNCLRLPPPEDSYSSILKVDTMLVSAAKRGCGYGVGLSKLRPYGATTSNSAKTSTGVLPFAERYSNSTKEVGQEGRRGACLEDLDIRHPESPEWATVKLDKNKLTGANISFKMWGDFMEAVKADEDYYLRFPVGITTKQIEAELESRDLPYGEMVNMSFGYVKRVKAKEVWDSAIHTVWSDGCPGLQFWDRFVNYDPCSVYPQYQIDGTNACGEQPMVIFDTCRLLVIALIRAIKNAFTSEAELDEDKLYNMCYTLLEVGDDLIDLEIIYLQRIIDKINSDKEDESTKAIELELWTKVLDMAKNGRRIGAGITGLADMLASVNLKYDSNEALAFTEKVMRIKFKAELNASIDLAIKYGAFEGWDATLEKDGNDWYRMVETEFPEEWERMQLYGRRFVNFNTIAPVGTTSIVTPVIEYFNMSAGCEPQFYLWFFRNKKVDKKEDPHDFIDEVGIRWKQHPIIMGAFKDWLKINFDITDFDILTKSELEEYYEKSPWFKATANDISWKKRIEMQSILQKYTTSAISSTINLPKDVKEEVISDIYLYAYEMGLKGITAYRDGSKGGVLVHEKLDNNKFEYHDAPKRPQDLNCEIFTTIAKGNKWNVVVGLFDEKPYEVFAINHFTNESSMILRKMKSGRYDLITKGGETYSESITSDMTDEESALTRMISTALRHGSSISFICQQLNKSHGSVVSFSKAVARVLSKYDKIISNQKEKCSECGEEAIVYEEGCKKCMNCFTSKCN